eukprot:10846558-Heterocapsa_arctica.AAC.1
MFSRQRQFSRLPHGQPNPELRWTPLRASHHLTWRVRKASQFSCNLSKPTPFPRSSCGAAAVAAAEPSSAP